MSSGTARRDELSGRGHRRGPRLRAPLRGRDHRITARPSRCRSSAPCPSSSPRSAGTTGRDLSRQRRAGSPWRLCARPTAGLAYALGMGAAGLVALLSGAPRSPVERRYDRVVSVGAAAPLGGGDRGRHHLHRHLGSRRLQLRDVPGARPQRLGGIPACAGHPRAGWRRAERDGLDSPRPRCRSSSRFYFVLILTLNLWLAAKTVQVSGRLPRPWPSIPSTMMPTTSLGAPRPRDRGRFPSRVDRRRGLGSGRRAFVRVRHAGPGVHPRGIAGAARPRLSPRRASTRWSSPWARSCSRSSPCSASPMRHFPSATVSGPAPGRSPPPSENTTQGENHGSDPARARRQARSNGRNREGARRLRAQLPAAARQGAARHEDQQGTLRSTARPARGPQPRAPQGGRGGRRQARTAKASSSSARPASPAFSTAPSRPATSPRR